MFTKLHNNLLREELRKLNDENNDKSLLMLNLYNALLAIINNRGVSMYVIIISLL